MPVGCTGARCRYATLVQRTYFPLALRAASMGRYAKGTLTGGISSNGIDVCTCTREGTAARVMYIYAATARWLLFARRPNCTHDMSANLRRSLIYRASPVRLLASIARRAESEILLNV